MAAVPARPAGSRTRHRKQFSLSRLSSDTTATLPEYSSPIWTLPVPDDEPPDYPDSADEADEETDDCSPLSPSLSPRRRRFARATSKRNTPYRGLASQSDTFLDSLLERSVNALELSNALLHSSMTAQSSLSNVLDVDQSSDRMLDARARGLSRRIRKNTNVQERWMDDLDDLAKDVEDFMDDGSVPVSHSLPSSSPLAHPKKWRKTSLEQRQDAGHLVSNATTRNLSSPPPRALTQYVSIRAEQGDALEETSGPSHIFLPSTIGLRSSSHVSDFSPPPFFSSSSPESSPVTSSLVRRQSASPSSHFTRTRPSRSPTPTCRPKSRSRSRSWSASKPTANSPKILLRAMAPPIAELPSQSDSSASDSPQQFRTVEQLRKILVEQSPPPKEPSPSRPTTQSQSFSPRSPPVTPVTSTSTTTTSISRLLTKGSHSTTTRAPSPPRMSSLKKRSSPLSSAGPSTLSIPDLANGSLSASPGPSSGRSTPRNVAFGPLPEPHRERPASGGLSKFQEQKEAKSRARRKRGGDSKEKGEKEKEGESSWWTTWLTGGSLLSMSTAKQEERAEDRMARWSRPGMGVGFEDWPV